MDNTNESVPLENMTSQEKTSWRLTGVEPVREEKVETKPEKVVEITKKPADDDAEVVAADGQEEGESGTPTKTEEKTRKPGQMSYKDLRTRIAELEAKIQAGTTKPAAADNEAVKADAKDKASEKSRPKSSDKKADGSPKYQTWEEYEDDLLEWRADKDRAAFKQDSVKAQQEEQKTKLQEELNKTVRQRADDARKKYADFDAKVFNKDLVIPKESVLYNWVMDAENESGMDIAYHYATHREDLDKFNKLSPFQQARELTRLEDKLSQAITTPEKSDVEVKATPTKVTKAPPPAKEVGGRGSASGNEEDGLVGAGDFRAYKRVVDKKEIATRK